MENEVNIRLDKGEYVGGDTIYGSVYLRIQQQVSSSALKLVVRGFQTCRYDYQYVHRETEGEEFTARAGQRIMTKDLIKQEITIAEGLFPVGCYAYPFMYQLPHNLPGVFNVQYEDLETGKSWEGLVQYTISAVLNIPGPPKKRISTEVGLVIYDNLECRNLQVAPDPQSASGSVKTFFCITRGTVHVACKLMQSAYYPTDRIIVSLQIRNDSSVDVAGFTVNLLRVIKLQALDRTRDEEDLTTHTLIDTVLESEGQGCPHNSTTSHEVVLNLSIVRNSERVGIPPNTSGSIVKCNYVIDVNVHIPWAPEVEVRQPLLIKAADNETWKAWNPLPWIDKCVLAQTTGIAAVPEDILSSQSFAGVPGFRPVIQDT